GTFNQAIMEFGARLCVPRNPDCENCILNRHCIAFKNNAVEEFPVKIKAKAVKKRYFNYLVIVSKNEKTLLKQRLGKGIWHKLFEFPLIETSEEVELDGLQRLEEYQHFTQTLNLESTVLYNENPIIHKLSHQHLNTRFWILETSEEKDIFVPISQIDHYAVP